MDTMNYSTFRIHLAHTLDKVNDDHKPVLITRQNGKPAAYEETAYLMASPKNAERLNQAIAEVEAGKTIQRGLIEE
jgi:antitoxin YefM